MTNKTLCLVVTLALVTGCKSMSTSAPAEVARQTKESQSAMTPTAAIERLRGNARFVAGQSQARNLPAEVRATAGGQYPFAVVLSCLDSRQPIEMIFDQGMGDVFNARVAGNVLNDDILGSLEFACKASGSKLIVVLGHSNCGAVKGAIDNVELGHLTGLCTKIKPAMSTVQDSDADHTSHNKHFVQEVCDANVKLVEQQIREQSPILREMLDKKEIALVGGMYDLGSGKVQFFDR